MNQKILDFVRKYEKATLVLLVLVFIFIRLPGTDLPLHQDEYKWPMIVNPAIEGDTEIPHPPLSQFIYRTAGYVVGFDTDFRFVPLFFGSVNLVLLYYLMKILYGRKEAIIASIIWIGSFFSVLASLMVDTDGEILPFFFLTSLISYNKFLKSYGRARYLWGSALILFCVLGFLVKVSFVLAITAIVADFLWSKRNLIQKTDVVKYLSVFAVGVVFLVGILYLTTYIFPFFDLSKSVEYWKHFAVGNRGWFQTVIQCVKALLYLSPFLVLVPFLGKKEWFYQAKSFIFFLIFSFLFYIVLFDFSLGALDRYLQLLILPLVVLSSVVVSKILDRNDRKTKEFLFLGTITGLVLILLQSIPHYVPPLHPKSDWIYRVMHLKWTFVYPFSGGSGPLGFYVSFLFIALAWIITFGFIVWAMYRPQSKKLALVFIIPISIMYNGIFVEEYLFGFWNGYAPGLLVSAIEYMKDDPDIKKVTTYNDNGGSEIQQLGKYRKRLYVDPKFDINEKVVTLNTYKEHYFVLNVPRLDPTSVYQKYFDSCAVIYDKKDRNMSAIIYDCRGVPDIKI